MPHWAYFSVTAVPEKWQYGFLIQVFPPEAAERTQLVLANPAGERPDAEAAEGRSWYELWGIILPGDPDLLTGVAVEAITFCKRHLKIGYGTFVLSAGHGVDTQSM